MDAKLRIEIGMLKSMSANEAPQVRLRIEDAPSGEALVEVYFDAGQWLNVTSGTSLTLPGFVGNHLDRVGKKMDVQTVDIPRAIASGRDVDKEAILDWIKTQGIGPYDSIEFRNTNHGWIALFRRWE